MQNNVQNNWKQRLENADTFSGEILKDKNASWDKLHTRLHKKPTPRYLISYWAATACLILAIITAILFLKPEKNQSSSSVTLSSPINNRIPAATDNALSIKPKNRTAVSFQTPKRNTLSISRQKKVTVKMDAPGKNNNAITDSPGIEELTATMNEPPLQFDSTKELTTAAPVKKKLRVVHINDLGQPLEESTADNPFVERHRFGLRIINNESYIPPSPPNNGIILFKSKNASN